MSNIQSFNDYSNRDNILNEKLVLENMDTNRYQRVTTSVMKKLGVELFYVNKYKLSISLLYPLVELFMIKNNFTLEVNKNNIVLLSICAVSLLTKEDKTKSKAVFKYAMDNGIADTELDKVNKFLSTLKELFTEISTFFDRKVSVFSDMLKDTELLTPFVNTLHSVISKELFDIVVLVYPLSDIKNMLGKDRYNVFINRIMHKLDKIIKSTSKFQNVDNIKPLQVNDEFKSPMYKTSKVKISKNF